MLYSYKKGIPKQLPETITIQEIVFEEVTHDVVTDENGIEETITVTEALGKNVETVLSAPFTEEQLSKAGYVLAPEKPVQDAFTDVTWGGTNWVIQLSDAAKLRDKMWENILKTRQDLLYSTDHLVYEYTNMPEENVQLWKAYRQSLRDITQYRTGKIDDWELVVLPKSPYQDTYDENGGTGE